MALSDARQHRRPRQRWGRNPPCCTGLPRRPAPPFQRAVPTTPADRDGCSCRLLPRPARPSPNLRRVGIRDFTFEACSGFTRVTARRIAQPPSAAFVARLQLSRLPAKPLASYQIKPTTVWVEPAVCLAMKQVGKPDAGNPHVRLDERGGE